MYELVTVDAVEFVLFILLMGQKLFAHVRRVAGNGSGSP